MGSGVKGWWVQVKNDLEKSIMRSNLRVEEFREDTGVSWGMRQYAVGSHAVGFIGWMRYANHECGL